MNSALTAFGKGEYACVFGKLGDKLAACQVFIRTACDYALICDYQRLLISVTVHLPDMLADIIHSIVKPHHGLAVAEHHRYRIHIGRRNIGIALILQSTLIPAALADLIAIGLDEIGDYIPVFACDINIIAFAACLLQKFGFSRYYILPKRFPVVHIRLHPECGYHGICS